ncbi:MAG: hypothetical protein ACYDDN_03820 [Candidatus Desulforudaceae bacterium]
MALHFYFDEAKTNQISEGTWANPDVVTGSGTTGFARELAIYVGNDSAIKRYESVAVTAVNDDAEVDIKYAPDEAGSPGAWADTLALLDIGASGVIKIWRKVTVAAGLPSQNRINIKHRVTCEEYAVD